MKASLFYKIFILVGVVMILIELNISIIKVFLFTVIFLILFEILKTFVQEELGVFK